MTTSDLPDDLDVDFQLVRFVRRSRAYAMSHLADIHEELDYNTFLLLLAVCDAKGGVRASELAEGMRVHKSTVSRAVSTLERLGLLDRATHPDDGRAQILTVPQDARDRVEAFRARSHAWLTELLVDWSPSELSSFAQQLARLNDAAEKQP
ncbi:MarR family winged helix-turn-helix transcriptional regulator [Aeromicrobium sp.]|uniref:MarR family winged helix-turn-helix transcriptional regulator n=1 Tax=Aeromicrobium sp. TaxID=1871063 RepID=UPI003D6B970C